MWLLKLDWSCFIEGYEFSCYFWSLYQQNVLYSWLNESSVKEKLGGVMVSTRWWFFFFLWGEAKTSLVEILCKQEKPWNLTSNRVMLIMCYLKINSTFSCPIIIFFCILFIFLDTAGLQRTQVLGYFCFTCPSHYPFPLLSCHLTSFSRYTCAGGRPWEAAHSVGWWRQPAARRQPDGVRHPLSQDDQWAAWDIGFPGVPARH